MHALGISDDLPGNGFIGVVVKCILDIPLPVCKHGCNMKAVGIFIGLTTV